MITHTDEFNITKNTKVFNREKAEKKFTKYKKQSLVLSNTYKKLDDTMDKSVIRLVDFGKVAKEIFDCGNYIKFRKNKYTGEMHLVEGFFCRKRLCPVCAYRKETKNFYQTLDIISQGEFKDKEFVFLTLTVQNCKADELKNTIKRMLSAFAKMTDNPITVFRKAFVGWFRSLEVTYNQYRHDYHPHIHILAAVEKDYFQKSNKYYFSKDRLQQHWQKFLKCDYLPIVDIKKVKEKHNSTNENVERNKAIAEVAKYTCKPVHYINNTEVVECLTLALRRVRCNAYGGLFRKVWQRMNMPDPDADQSTKYTKDYVKKLSLDLDFVDVIFRWIHQNSAYIVKDESEESDKKVIRMRKPVTVRELMLYHRAIDGGETVVIINAGD